MINRSKIVYPTELSCQKLERFIDDYLENKLPGVKRDIFESHVNFCPGCLNYLTNYRNTVRLGKTAYAENHKGGCVSVPKNLVEAILRANDVK